MPRLGGGAAGGALVQSIGPASPASLVPGSPAEHPNAGQPFRFRCIAGTLIQGAGVITCVHHTGNDGNPADGQVLPAIAVILLEKDSGETIFYQTLNPGAITPPIWIPFRGGLVAYANAFGVIVAGVLGQP